MKPLAPKDDFHYLCQSGPLSQKTALCLHKGCTFLLSEIQLTPVGEIDKYGRPVYTSNVCWQNPAINQLNFVLYVREGRFCSIREDGPMKPGDQLLTCPVCDTPHIMGFVATDRMPTSKYTIT